MKNTLYYTKPAKAWEEALPVGNGRLGAMVFGNLKRERIALNEDTLWSGYPKDLNNKSAGEHLGDIRDAIFSGDHDRAKQIANRDMHGHWSESYLPFGDICIDYKGTTGVGYSRTLDISRGVATVQNSKVRQTVFASHPAQMIVINIHSDNGVSFSLSFFSKLRHRCYTREDSLVIEGQAPEICMPPYYNDGTVFDYGEGAMRFCGVARVLGNAVFDDDRIIVTDQQDTTILISLATSFVDYDRMPTADAVERAYSYFGNTKPYDTLLAEHKADFAALFDRVDIDLGKDRSDLPTDKRLRRFQKHDDDNGLIALLFQYGRYLTISCSRPGSRCMNLQGIFNQHLRAPWSSSYTTNINTEMNYWPTDICNLSECFAPFIEQVRNMAENGRQTAHDHYRCGGSCAHHNSDIWGAAYPAGDPMGNADSESYACWQSALPWMLSQVYHHYRYTGDEDMMQQMRPYYGLVLDFYNDFMVERDGMLVTCPNISPENIYSDDGKRAGLTYMPTMDIGILQDFFACCRELGYTTPQLPDIPIGTDGRINEWVREYAEPEPEHRHVSHLYCIYPSAVEQGEDIRSAARASLMKRGFGGTGWSLGWKVCLWARLDNADNALRLIKNQLYPISPSGIRLHRGGGSYPNLFDAHPPFQIDGNFGVTAGIAEMLTRGTIPSCWSGYARGLRLPGGKTVDIEFADGRITTRRER